MVCCQVGSRGLVGSMTDEASVPRLIQLFCFATYQWDKATTAVTANIHIECTTFCLTIRHALCKSRSLTTLLFGVFESNQSPRVLSPIVKWMGETGIHLVFG